MPRFAGFEVDQQRAELRGPGGSAIKLRPKTFDLLINFVGQPRRILSKQELMDAVWPNVHVGDDSLFQCIRELRAAIGDDQREIIKVVSGRGYMFEAEVSADPPIATVGAPLEHIAGPLPPAMQLPTPHSGRRFGISGAVAAAIAAIVIGAAFAATIFNSDPTIKRPPTVAVSVVAETNLDLETSLLAAAVADRLIDGLAKIDNIHVLTPNMRKQVPAREPAPTTDADYAVTGELSKGKSLWTLRTRMIKTATGQVEAIPTITIDERDLDESLLQTRLAAGTGHLLAVRINALVDAEATPVREDSPSRQSSVKVAIEQATASIVQTSRDRFFVAQAMLEKALTDNPGNVDLEVALAALQMRGIQMLWYSPEESVAAEKSTQAMLERVLKAKPANIPALEAYCRFLNATNQFVDSLVACARILAFDPWNGMALYHMGVAQIHLGRYEDALAIFKEADRFDTPQVSRWTWLLGAGWSHLLLGHYEEALPWLQKSIAITPASGRPLMLLAAAYQGAGRPGDAKAALAQALQIRPGSTAGNIQLPFKNSSPAFLASSKKVTDALIEVGLPNN